MFSIKLWEQMMQFSLNERIFCLTTAINNTQEGIPGSAFARVWDVDAAAVAAHLCQVLPCAGRCFHVLAGAGRCRCWQARPPFTEVLHLDSQQPCISPTTATAVLLRADGAIALWTTTQCSTDTQCSNDNETVTSHCITSDSSDAALAPHPSQQCQDGLVYLPGPPLWQPQSNLPSCAAASSAAAATVAADGDGGGGDGSDGNGGGDIGDGDNGDQDNSEWVIADSNWRWLVVARGNKAHVHDFILR
ncbi:hypothetical protein CLOM_g16161 [Closterium sp. NIES-68]|nr:hypothetical protein CLOM_g9609 [Closterium sp. NIES-68]GJP57121.1 hypothetical protein CLOM_g16161 [Closterium sp. NIES-68]GJP74171.1 hypothetical protein CLOP_g4798 [Closterium sp. NIES-67]